MAQGNACIAIATSGANLTVLTGPGYFFGALLYASGAAATLTIVDSAKSLISWSGATAAVLNFAPLKPVSIVNGLSVTNSGAGTYTILYATAP